LKLRACSLPGCALASDVISLRGALEGDVSERVREAKPGTCQRDCEAIVRVHCQEEDASFVAERDISAEVDFVEVRDEPHFGQAAQANLAQAKGYNTKPRLTVASIYL